MCEFISWIEKDGAVLFLTYNDIYNTKRGKELQKHCKNPEDYVGHGAIRFFYELENGRDKEQTDFSTPDNFPKEIVKAIKKGLFAGLGIPIDLLTSAALAEYEKKEQPAYAECQKIRQAAYAEYEKIKQAAFAEYEKIRQAALAEYEKIRQAALAEYEKIRQFTFWKLFKNKKNRNLLWR